MCDPLLVDWPWGPMASLLRDKDIQEKLPSRKTNLRKIIDSTTTFFGSIIFGVGEQKSTPFLRKKERQVTKLW